MNQYESSFHISKNYFEKINALLKILLVNVKKTQVIVNSSSCEIFSFPASVVIM